MVIADTGFFVAAAATADRDHELAVETLRELSGGLVTTWPVLTETTHLLAARLGVPAMLSFVATVRGGAYRLFDLTPAMWPRIEVLMRRYRGLPMDLADASLVILAEDQDDGRILSTDRRHFRTYRWKSRRPFTNLLDPG